MYLRVVHEVKKKVKELLGYIWYKLRKNRYLRVRFVLYIFKYKLPNFMYKMTLVKK